jgi:PilZ domain
MRATSSRSGLTTMIKRKFVCAMNGRRVRNGAGHRLLMALAGPFRVQRGDATYSIISETQRPILNRRLQSRRQTHLQSGKIVSGADQFLVECLIVDCAPTGLCIKLSRAVEIPADVLLYDDSHGTLIHLRVVWRRGLKLGCRIEPAPAVSKEKLTRKLGAWHYAVG